MGSQRLATTRPRSRAWAWAGRILTVVFVILVGWLIVARARTIDWDQVGESLRSYGAPPLLLAVFLAAISYLLYGGYELVARAYTRHKLPRGRVAAIALVTYAFNLNLSAWIGGIGFRFRLYSKNGLHAGMITRILGVSLATNWLGYLCLAGSVFTFRLLPLPEGWAIGTVALQGIGLVLLATAATYLVLSTRQKRPRLKIRTFELQVPPAPMALTQVSLSMANWLVIATILFVLLRGQVPFHTVLAILLVASIAGVVAHIPAGLGVIEAVFFTFLGTTVAEEDLLAALLAYRAVYYLLPLAVAIVVYLTLEARTRHHPATAVSPT